MALGKSFKITSAIILRFASSNHAQPQRIFTPTSSRYADSQTYPRFSISQTGIMTSTIGIPIKLLNEAQVRSPSLHHPAFSLDTHEALLVCQKVANSSPTQGHVVTLEITSGQVYRGKLLEGESSRSLGIWSQDLLQRMVLTYWNYS
jgi:hypothetical protein